MTCSENRILLSYFCCGTIGGKEAGPRRPPLATPMLNSSQLFLMPIRHDVFCTDDVFSFVGLYKSFSTFILS